MSGKWFDALRQAVEASLRLPSLNPFISPIRNGHRGILAGRPYRTLVGLALVILLNIAPAHAQRSPGEVVSLFLDGWNTQNYAEMYRLVHPQSRELYPQPVFEARYQQVAERIALSGVQYTIRSTQMQGESAAVHYDVSIASEIFTTINDPGRTMRLMNTPEGWRIAWSSLDIFDMLAGESQLQVQSRPRIRAPILDRDGDPVAWDGGTLTALYSAQQNMFGVQDCRNLLAQISRESLVDIERQFANRTPDNVFFLGVIPTEIYEQNAQRLLETCGADPALGYVFDGEPQRVYYGGNAMSHVAGYVGQIPAEELAEWQLRGYSAGDLIGIIGIESAYQDTLAGKPESVLRIIEPGGTILREIAGTTGTDPTPVTLTIDRELQLIVVQAMADAFNYARPGWGDPSVSPGGAAVVLDVHTGAILAMTSYPLVNPAVFHPTSPIPDRPLVAQQIVVDTREPLRNRAISEQFSPGSVYKVVTLAAILNEGLIAPDKTFYCDLYWYGQEFGDTLERRSDWRVVDGLDAAGEITPAQALMASCNPFFWQHGAILYRDIGPNALTDYSRRMGLGQRYGLNMGFLEAAGSLEPPASPDQAITEAVGQFNVAISPIQMAVLTAAVANGGTVYRPYVVQQVGGVDATPVTFTAAPEVLNTFDFEPGVLETIQEGMCGVTTNKDLGTAYIRFQDPSYHRVANYTVCGKTGTAQTARYPNAWFIAYAPADNPQIAVVVMVEQSREGSQVSAPIVRRILDDYFQQPRADFPDWWNESYLPLEVPEGGGSG